MYSGIFDITERMFDTDDTRAFIEITDDNRVRVTRIDANPAVPQALLFDLPARDVFVYGSLGTIVIKAAGHTITSNRAPEMISKIYRSRLISAGRHAAASGAKEWAREFRRAGSRSWFLTYAGTIWITLGLMVLIGAWVIAYAISITP